MTRRRTATGLALALVLLAGPACSDDDDGAAGTTTAPAVVTTSPPSTAAPTTAAEATTTTAPAPAGPDVPVLWPVGDELITNPVELVTQLMEAYLPGNDVVVGEFQQGDNNSGEVPVIGRTESGQPGNLRTTVLVRRFGEGWYATAAINQFAKFTVPDAGGTVSAGVATVEGAGRGFEASIAVRALPAGGGAPLAEAITLGGSFETPEPFVVDLDLSGAAVGDTVVLSVQGGTGLDRDPGEFSLIPVVVVVD